MYCQNCGKELCDGERFCSKCGTKAGSGSTTPKISVDSQKIRETMAALPGRVRSMGLGKALYWAGLALLAVSLLMLNKDMFEVTVSFLGTQKMSYSMFEGAGFVKICFYIGYVAAILWMLRPQLSATWWEEKYFYIAMAMPVVSAVWLLAAKIVAEQKVKDTIGYDFVADSVKLGYNSNAWIFLLISLAAFLVVREAKRRLTDGGAE